MRYLFAESPAGEKLRIGAPGVTFNAGRNETKRKLREVKKMMKRARREEKRRQA